ncbi:hypothetical protein [Cupriavidus sp. TMH.W2]|uniref:hypothetical protein n=1 Tax=Cupriavidus sp. TMH.W2 TaxID=3434465 RepID=UPI003D7772BB
MVDNRPILAAPVAPVLRHLIDDAVHRAVSGVTSKDGYMRCADYAIVGARVLTLLTQVTYRPVAGGEVMNFGDGMLYVLCSPRARRRNAKHLSQLSRYHCWIEGKHAYPDGSSRVEVVDFTVRHDHAAASEVGIPFKRMHECFLWTWKDEDVVPPELHSHPAFAKGGLRWRWAERDCTDLLRAYEKERPNHFARQVSRALDLFADRVENGVDHLKSFAMSK